MTSILPSTLAESAVAMSTPSLAAGAKFLSPFALDMKLLDEQSRSAKLLVASKSVIVLASAHRLVRI
jgi:hypothetical protein